MGMGQDDGIRKQTAVSSITRSWEPRRKGPGREGLVAEETGVPGVLITFKTTV